MLLLLLQHLLDKKRENNMGKNFEKKNEKWMKRYGVKYTDCLPKKEKVGKKRTREINYLKKMSFIFKGHKKSFIIFFLLGILSAVLALFSPILYQKIIDGIALGNISESFRDLLILILMLTVVSILTRVVNHIQANVINKHYHQIAHQLRVQLITKTTQTKISKFDNTSTGDILNRIDRSSNIFSAGIVNYISYIPDIIAPLMFIGYALYINIWIGLLLTVGGLITFLIDTLGYKYYILKYNRCSNLLFDKRINQYNETVRGIRDIKSLNATSQILSRITNTSKYSYRASWDNSRSYNTIRTIKISTRAVLFACALILGIIFVRDNALSLGALIAILVYRSNFEAFFGNLGDLINEKRELNISAERMYEIFDEKNYPKEIFGKRNLKNISGDIVFDNVSFSYNEDKLLENFSLSIKANECVGLVGKSGQGKSTIISLIARFYDAQKGTIEIDGVNIKNLTEKCLRENVTIVPQMPYIFNASIKDNLRLAKENATDMEIEEACKKAFLFDFVNTLPNKFDTVVGEGGVTLSGGQRQRLALARAFLKPTRILILDEATSSLDNESQEKIKQVISDMKNLCTIIIIAHRLTTVVDCDKIFVLDEHKIIDQGSHKQLLKSCEKYKELYGKENQL